MAWDLQGDVVVADSDNHRLQVIRLSDGACLRIIGRKSKNLAGVYVCVYGGSLLVMPLATVVDGVTRVLGSEPSGLYASNSALSGLLRECCLLNETLKQKRPFTAGLSASNASVAVIPYICRKRGRVSQARHFEITIFILPTNAKSEDREFSWPVVCALASMI